jgi:transforming growth factor-beta-induced protein
MRSAVLLAGLGLGFLAACGDDDDGPDSDLGPPPQEDLLTVFCDLSNSESGGVALSQIRSLLSPVDPADPTRCPTEPIPELVPLQATLTGTVTFFAPSDGAIEALPPDIADALLTFPDVLADVLRFHMLPEARSAGQLIAEGTVSRETLLQPDPDAPAETLTTLPSQSTVGLLDGLGNERLVVTGNVQGATAFLHIIDGVLLPPLLDTVLQDIVLAEDLLAAFSALLESADLVVPPSADQTLLLPSEAALDAYFADRDRVGFDALDPTVAEAILLGHVLPLRITGGQLALRDSVPTAAGTELPIEPSMVSNQVNVGGADVVAPDLRVTEGVAHGIDRVIVPPPLLDLLPAVASEMADEIVRQPEVAPEFMPAVLTGEAPITILAPNDFAFDVEGLTSREVARVLRTHGVRGAISPDQWTDGATLTSLAGTTLTVRVGSAIEVVDPTGASATVDRLEGQDRRGRDGFVVRLDRQLNPGMLSVNELLFVRETYGRLLSALARAGLEDDVANATAQTLFAPSDTAFAAAGLDLTGLDVGVVQNILLHHRTPETLTAAELVNRSPVTSSAGTRLTVQVGPLRVNDAPIDVADQEASNGRVHGTSAVLVPPTHEEFLEEAALAGFAALIDGASAEVQADFDPQTLQGATPVTVLAPTDAAVAAAQARLAPLTPTQVALVLRTHLLPGNRTRDGLAGLGEVQAVSGQTLGVDIDGAGFRFEDANEQVGEVLRTTRTASGIVHEIDRVLFPDGIP